MVRAPPELEGAVGAVVDATVGVAVGALVGATVGALVGEGGTTVGAMVGAFVGATVGAMVGVVVGGTLVGAAVGVAGAAQEVAKLTNATPARITMTRCSRRNINLLSKIMAGLAKAACTTLATCLPVMWRLSFHWCRYFFVGCHVEPLHSLL